MKQQHRVMLYVSASLLLRQTISESSQSPEDAFNLSAVRYGSHFLISPCGVLEKVCKYDVIVGFQFNCITIIRIMVIINLTLILLIITIIIMILILHEWHLHSVNTPLHKHHCSLRLTSTHQWSLWVPKCSSVEWGVKQFGVSPSPSP